MQRTTRITTAALMAALLLPMSALADLDNAASSAGGSAMPTTTDIYNRLATGADITIPGTFQAPTAGAIASSRKTLAEIQAVLPVQDAVNGALAADVLATKTFWGLGAGGAWGLQTGSIPVGSSFSGANGLLTFPIPNGNYTGSKTATAVDSNLVSGNIKSGTSIFGVAGSATSLVGTAVAADVLAGATFSNGTVAGLTGTMVNNGAVTITPGTTPQTIAAGYHTGSGTITGDANLVAANINQAVNLFGVAGSYLGPYSCSGTLYGTTSRWCDNGDGTVRDMTTGLLWLKDANCGATLGGITKTATGAATDMLIWADASIWSSALATGSCGLTDGSAAGMWRVPTKDELAAITVVPDAVLKGWPWPWGFNNVQGNYYWSSTSSSNATYSYTHAFPVSLNNGSIQYTYTKTDYYYVWPVRGGQ